MVISYDNNMAKKHDLFYHPQVYRMMDYEIVDSMLPSVDVFFVGEAKDRLDKIHKAFKVLSDNGVSCNFYVTGVDDEDQKYKDHIKYNKRLSYSEVIDNLIHANCILEIVQGDSNGYTLRFLEALFYNKKIITDNPSILNSDYCHDPRIQYLYQYEELEPSFAKSPCRETFSDEERKKYTLSSLIEFIEKNI